MLEVLSPAVGLLSPSLLRTSPGRPPSRCYNINAQERICSLVNRAKVVVFMRGTERSPSSACSGSRAGDAALRQSFLLS